MLSVDVRIYKNIEEKYDKCITNIIIDSTKKDFLDAIKQACKDDFVDDSHYDSINILKVTMKNGLTIVLDISKINNIGYTKLFEIMEEARNGYTDDNQNRGNN